MTIQAADIKLLQSERMTDAADGGGRMTSTELPDGVAGALFPKVSRLDAVYGRVNIRKIYAAVMSALADTYGGAHAIITDPPDNPRISCVLFSTGSHFDTRADARNRIESYVVAGALSRMRLYGTQIIGQRSLLVYQRTEETLPDVGDTVCLSVEAAGYAAAQQYVRIEDVEHEVRTFTDAAGDFDRRVIRLALTSPLAQTFVGAEPVRVSGDPSPTKVRDTQVADTARYYGIRALAVAAQAGDVDLQLDSIYTPIVPGTQRETAISMVQMAGAIQYVQTGPETTVGNMYVVLGGSSPRSFLPMSAMPGSIKIPSIAGWKDNGDGTFSATSFAGTIDYNTGEMKQTSGAGYYEAYTSVTFTPGREVATQSHTHSTPITLGTRGLVYTMQLDPMPGAGSLTVDYRVLGRWYRLRDDGTGRLVGASAAEGTGQVSFTSGAAVATLGALPDVDSAVIWTWASPLHWTLRAGATADNPDWGLELPIQLPDFPARPDSVSIVYTAAGTTYTMQDNASGVFSYSGSNNPGVTASINYATGLILLKASSTRPATSSIITVSYEQELAAPAEQLLTTTSVAVTSPAAWNCGRTNFAPRSVRINRPMYSWGGFVPLVDDGSGGLVTLFAKFGDIVVSAGQSAGTVNYTTGDITLTNISASGRVYQPSIPEILGVPQPGRWESTADVLPPLVASYDVTAKSSAVSYSSKTYSETIGDIGYRYDVTRTVGESVVPGSLWMFFSGSTNDWAGVTAQSFVDRGNGLLYTSMLTTSGEATVAGELDYETGIATLRDLPYGGSAQAISPVRSCLTARGAFSVVVADFRTPGSPLRPASFYVQATAVDGTQCVGTADQNGVITGTHLRGYVKSLTGVAHVEFGDLVTGSWVPRAVLPGTIRFSAVVLSNLSLDPSILGLDPVRLPSDGRAPVVRAGDVAVVHHTGSVVYASPAAGGAISAGRANLAAVEVRDAEGKRVPADRYSIDMATGNGTWATPLVLTGYALPLTLRHRIEDMGMVADAQISGSVSLAAPLLRDYPLGSWLSTALLAGDMVARAENVFDQASWTNAWSDTLIGSSAVAELNTLQYPIEVSNEGAIKERWRAQIKSLSPLTIDVYGEALGLVGTYPASGTIAPVNPLTGKVYFAIQPGAWGAGNGAWAVGNQVRFNTVSAAYPITVLRTILSGAALTGDAVYIESRGDVD